MFTKKLFAFLTVFLLTNNVVFAQEASLEEGGTTGEAITEAVEEEMGESVLETTSDTTVEGLSVETEGEGGLEISETEPAVDIVPTSAPVEEMGEISGTTISPETEAESSMGVVLKWAAVIAAILLIITILMQERGTGLSSTFGGSGGFYASKRGVEKVLFRFTVLLAFSFGILTMLSSVL